MTLSHQQHRFNPLASAFGRYDHSYRDPFLSIRIAVDLNDCSPQSSAAASLLRNYFRFFGRSIKTFNLTYVQSSVLCSARFPVMNSFHTDLIQWNFRFTQDCVTKPARLFQLFIRVCSRILLWLLTVSLNILILINRWWYFFPFWGGRTFQYLKISNNRLYLFPLGRLLCLLEIWYRNHIIFETISDFRFLIPI